MILKDRNIDYKLLGIATEYYENAGFEYIETPWTVGYRACVSTAPNNVPGYAVEAIVPDDSVAEKQFFVCSAEQGFVEMYNAHLLSSEQRYCSVSPCMRYEDDTEIHSKEFMKLELFAFSYDIDRAKTIMRGFVAIAANFFRDHIDHNVRTIDNDDGSVDIVANPDSMLELGSYGIRIIDSRGYIVYGTGLALPRASLAFEQSKKGYHRSVIPKGFHGSSSKILEEVYEFLDAEKQDNKVMMLCELSDIIAAIKQYIEDEYNSSVSIDDLIVMAEATDRAFKSGQRT